LGCVFEPSGVQKCCFSPFIGRWYIKRNRTCIRFFCCLFVHSPPLAVSFLHGCRHHHVSLSRSTCNNVVCTSLIHGKCNARSQSFTIGMFASFPPTSSSFVLFLYDSVVELTTSMQNVHVLWSFVLSLTNYTLYQKNN
jgi:hypothetical protein